MNNETKFLNEARLRDAALIYQLWGYKIAPLVDLGEGWQPLFDWDNVDLEMYHAELESRMKNGDNRNDAEVRFWFDDKGFPVIRGLAIELGSGTCKVQCRRFKTSCAYDSWRQSHESWANKLPTMKSVKGIDVFFRRPSLQNRVRELTDGQIRGAGTLCLVPPTTYRGVVCQWITDALSPHDVPFVESPVTKLDIRECGLFDTYPVE
jgi:hypothetical protein